MCPANFARSRFRHVCTWAYEWEPTEELAMWMWVPVRFHSSVSTGVCPFKTKYTLLPRTGHFCRSGPATNRAPAKKSWGPAPAPSPSPSPSWVQACLCDWRAGALRRSHPPPRWSQAQTCGPANDRKDGTGLAAATAVKPAAAANAGQTAFCAARRRHHPPAAALEPSPKPTAPATRKCLFCDCLRTPLRGHACGDRGRDCRAR